MHTETLKTTHNLMQRAIDAKNPRAQDIPFILGVLAGTEMFIYDRAISSPYDQQGGGAEMDFCYGVRFALRELEKASAAEKGQIGAVFNAIFDGKEMAHGA